MSTQEAKVRFPDPRGLRLSDLIAALPEGAVIEIAPGRYFESIHISRSVTLRGAGDLTRIGGLGRDSIITVDAEGAEVHLESMSLEGGGGPAGGGVCLRAGQLELRNLRIHRARAERGGALAVLGGHLSARLLRVEDVRAKEGGAIWVGDGGVLELSEAEIRGAKAERGGMLYADDGSRVALSALTVSKARAKLQEGGQVLWIEGARTVVSLERVRLADPAIGRPLAGGQEALIQVTGSDLPGLVSVEPGVVDLGGNRWR
ncbi:MAG: hypothetical protein U1E65_24695 [Myxococcota bacterium]